MHSRIPRENRDGDRVHDDVAETAEFEVGHTLREGQIHGPKEGHWD